MGKEIFALHANRTKQGYYYRMEETPMAVNAKKCRSNKKGEYFAPQTFGSLTPFTGTRLK